jgi:7-cyano-7-deazaguanine synthase
MNHALVVLSGGQDSTTCLGWALANFDKVSTITFDYGQRHSIEVEAAGAVRRHFEEKLGIVIDHELVVISAGVLRSTSPLVSGAPLELYKDHDSMEAVIGDRVEKTFVPMRNALFLTIAANRAVAIGARHIVTGVCQADNANYPDCRLAFIEAQENTINEALGPGPGIVIDTPLMDLSKAASIKLALTLPHTYEALAFSHTAYDGKYPPTGSDHASILRAHGFEQAGVPDPLVVRAYREGRMALPATDNYEGVGWREAPAELPDAE